MRGHEEILGRWEIGKWNTRRRKGTPMKGTGHGREQWEERMNEVECDGV